MMRKVFLYTILILTIFSVAPIRSAEAIIWWPAPPKCVEDYTSTKDNRIAYYTKAYEYTKKISYGGGTEIRYIWVWEVQIPIYPYGLVSAGRAERHCGTRWIPDRTIGDVSTIQNQVRAEV